MPLFFVVAVSWCTMAWGNLNFAPAKLDLKTPLGMESLRQAGTKFRPSDVSDVRRRAQLNDPEALYFLGVMHYYGNAADVEHSVDDAIKYFTKASELGHASSQVNLGMILLNNPRSSNDVGQAVSHFHRAAENGDSDAQWCLGRVYYEARIGHGPD